MDIKFAEARINEVGPREIEAFRKQLFQRTCKEWSAKQLLDNGVTLHLRMARPNGAPLSYVAFDQESCAPYVEAKAVS